MPCEAIAEFLTIFSSLSSKFSRKGPIRTTMWQILSRRSLEDSGLRGTSGARPGP